MSQKILTGFSAMHCVNKYERISKIFCTFIRPMIEKRCTKYEVIRCIFVNVIVIFCWRCRKPTEQGLYLTFFALSQRIEALQCSWQWMAGVFSRDFKSIECGSHWLCFLGSQSFATNKKPLHSRASPPDEGGDPNRLGHPWIAYFWTFCFNPQVR